MCVSATAELYATLLYGRVHSLVTSDYSKPNFSQLPSGTSTMAAHAHLTRALGRPLWTIAIQCTKLPA